jgi:hypothetical protein
MDTGIKPPFATLEPGQLNVPVADGIELPSGGGSLDFLQAVYRDAGQPLPVRMRAAIAALPFERPKLAVTANVDAYFGRRMELAMERRGVSAVIDARPVKAD